MKIEGVNNTHEVFVKIGENCHAFISGIPDKCDHDWNGDVVYYTQSGKRITPYTFIKWVGYTSNFRGKLIHEHQINICDPINAGTVTCSKCKKDMMPQF